MRVSARATIAPTTAPTGCIPFSNWWAAEGSVFVPVEVVPPVGEPVSVEVVPMPVLVVPVVVVPVPVVDVPVPVEFVPVAVEFAAIPAEAVPVLPVDAPPPFVDVLVSHFRAAFPKSTCRA